jgi:PPOX class probable F420-dependent enzyme
VGLPPEAVGLLRRPDVLAYLATTNADGSPHVAPLWADVDDAGEHVVLNTAEGRRKVANVRRDPRVMVGAHAPDALEAPLFLWGRVVEITSEGAEQHIDALARRYTGRPWSLVEGQVRLRLVIQPDRVVLDA